MSLPIALRKKQLRDEARARLLSLSPEERPARSGKACARLIDTPGFKAARTIMLYMAMPEETDTAPLLEAAHAAGMSVCVPRMDWAARTMIPVIVDGPEFITEVRHHGVSEPVSGFAAAISELDLVVVPGLAFDPEGHRLGRGAGFYDRFLSAFRSLRSPSASAFGLCFDLQIVDQVPAEAHDELLDGVVSESRLLLCRGRPS